MRHLLLLAAMLCAPALQATPPAAVPVPAAPVERSYPAFAHVSEEGSVASVDVGSDVPAQLVGMVRQAVETLGFQPATVDGVPAASRTAVVVRIRFTPGEAGALTASVVGVERAQVRMTPPRYPREAITHGVSGRVFLEIAVLPDGRVDPANSRVSEVQLSRYGAESRRGRGYAQQLSEAALQAASGWVVQVEEVAGVPQSTRIETFVQFCADAGKTPGECPGLARHASALTRRAADSRVQLAQLPPPAAAPGA